MTLDELGETITPTVAGGLTVTEEWADLVASATLVAVTVAVVAELTPGAVNMPLLEIVPPVAVQVTAVFEVFLTVAVNCWLPAESRLDEVGETATLTTADGFTVTVDREYLVGSATLVAVTVAVAVVVTLRAVNNPLLEIVPPSAVQVTAVFEVLVTVTENCCVPADGTLAVLGDTMTLTPELPLPPTVMDTIPSPRSAFGKSEIDTRKLKDPAVVGVPATVPFVVFKYSPGGMMPRTKANWYGAVPPLTLILPLYGTEMDAIGS